MDTPTTLFAMAVVFVVMALLAYVLGIKYGKRSVKLPEPMVFDLTKAIATSKFASTPEQVGAVMGVVVGVLGLENTVASDAVKLRHEEETLQKVNTEEVTANEQKIVRLQAQIEGLRASSETSRGRVTKADEVEKLFAA